MSITEGVMEIDASIERDIPSRIGGSNRVFIRSVIARAIMAEREACLNEISMISGTNVQPAVALAHAYAAIRNRP